MLNIFFTFGILASFQAVLTLSGIAGMAAFYDGVDGGIGVNEVVEHDGHGLADVGAGHCGDANVLIFERAKEELRAGKNARNAIADGYSNAFSAICPGSCRAGRAR